jgi:hypothetical protein
VAVNQKIKKSEIKNKNQKSENQKKTRETLVFTLSVTAKNTIKPYNKKLKV